MPLNNQSSGGGGGWKSGGNGGGNSPWGQGGGSGGGGGGGGGGPWGSGGGGGGKEPPDLEDILKRGQDRVKQVMDGGGLPTGPILLLVGAALTAFIAWNAFFFRVNADEVAAVLRFGEFSRQEGPGLHSRLPYPIDEVRTIKVTDQKIMDISTKPTNAAQSNTKEMMLTADENIVDVRFNVLWRIKLDQDSIKLYLFNIQNPDQTVREVAESVMREVVGLTPLLPLLTEARLEVQKSVQERMQTILDQYGAGVRIDQVQLREVDPPSSVIASFRDVQAAAQERETKIKEAQKYAEQIVTVTKGEADRIKALAQGYKDQTVAEATGQAARFIKVYDEYKKAPEVTRQRLYLETMERVLGGADKFIIDQRQGQGVVPYLPLNELATARPKPTGSN